MVSTCGNLDQNILDQMHSDLRRARPELYREMLERYQESSRHIQDICPVMRHKLMGKHRTLPC